MFKKIIIVFFLLLVFLEGFSISCFTAEKDTLSIEKVLSKRPREEQYCFDFADVVPAKIIDRINDEAAGLKNAFDIDFVIVVLPSLGKRELNEFTADLFSKWQIGKNTQGKKGLLILLSMQEQQIKTEVGYDLEEVYTDMYVGQVEREMLKEFLEQADWERGFLATIENFVERTYRAYKEGLAVKEIASSGKEDYYSGGAGTKIIFDFGAAMKKPLPQTPQELRNYFTAQPTPELTFQRYMEFNAQNMSDYTLDIFSEDSQVVRKEGDPWTGLYFGYSQPYERDIEDVQLSVLSVVKNSPADKAGFKSGDLIYSVPGSQDQHVGFYDYKELLKRVKPKDKVKFKVLRNLKERIEIELEIGSYSSEKEGI